MNRKILAPLPMKQLLEHRNVESNKKLHSNYEKLVSIKCKIIFLMISRPAVKLRRRNMVGEENLVFNRRLKI